MGKQTYRRRSRRRSYRKSGYKKRSRYAYRKKTYRRRRYSAPKRLSDYAIRSAVKRAEKKIRRSRVRRSHRWHRSKILTRSVYVKELGTRLFVSDPPEMIQYVRSMYKDGTLRGMKRFAVTATIGRDRTKVVCVTAPCTVTELKNATALAYVSSIDRLNVTAAAHIGPIRTWLKIKDKAPLFPELVSDSLPFTSEPRANKRMRVESEEDDDESDDEEEYVI